MLRNVRDAEESGPILVHAITQKGRGYAPAEAATDKLHAVSRFNVMTGEQVKAPPGPPSYTKVFADALIAEAAANPKVVAITAAMPSGTGLDRFAKRFPDRCFDVGIAEQHAVTFAAGMATEGMVPFCAIYSTFLQRAYDQVVHDVASRAAGAVRRWTAPGLGGGGWRHACRQLRPGLSRLPARHGADGARRRGGVGAHGGDAGGVSTPAPPPCATRAARARGSLCRSAARRCRSAAAGCCARGDGSVAILSLGPRLADALVAADELAARGLRATVADARFAKPLDTALIERLARDHGVLVTIEDGSVGGFGSAVMQHLALGRAAGRGRSKIRPMVLPDRFIDHNNPAAQLVEAGLTPKDIVRTVLEAATTRPSR